MRKKNQIIKSNDGCEEIKKRESHDDLGPVMLIHQNHPERNGQDSRVSSGVTVSYSKTTYITAWGMKTNARSLSFTGLAGKTVLFLFLRVYPKYTSHHQRATCHSSHLAIRTGE